MDYFKNAALGLVLIAIGLGCILGISLRKDCGLMQYVIPTLLLLTGIGFFIYSERKWEKLREDG